MAHNLAGSSDAPRQGGDLLAAIAREIGDLASEAQRLQDVLAHIGSSRELSEQALIGVQALDALAQHASELSAITSAVGALAPQAWVVPTEDLLDGVSLAGLARRLSSDDHAGRDHEHAAGEFEMF
jgi:hypothetical protein